MKKKTRDYDDERSAVYEAASTYIHFFLLKRKVAGTFFLLCVSVVAEREVSRRHRIRRPLIPHSDKGQSWKLGPRGILSSEWSYSRSIVIIDWRLDALSLYKSHPISVAGLGQIHT